MWTPGTIYMMCNSTWQKMNELPLGLDLQETSDSIFMFEYELFGS